MISTVKFEEWHLPLVRSKVENGDVSQAHEIMKNMDEDTNHIVTIAYEDKALAILAGTFLFDQVVHVSAIVGEDVRDYPLSFVKECLRLFKVYEEQAGVKRFQMDVQADWDEAVRFAERLGLKREAVMKNYGRECKDYYLYARYS